VVVTVLSVDETSIASVGGDEVDSGANDDDKDDASME